LNRLNAEARYAADEHQMSIVDWYAKTFGYQPAWISDDTTDGAMSGLKHLSKTNEGTVPQFFSIHIGSAGEKGKIAGFTMPPPDKALDFVNFGRVAMGVPKLNDAQWRGLSADDKEERVMQINQLWMPSKLGDNDLPGQLSYYKGLRDTFVQRGGTDGLAPEVRSEVIGKFDSAINMLEKSMSDSVTRKLDYKRKESEITESAKVRAEDRADARRRRNNDEPSIKDANLLRDDYNRDLKQLEWPTIQASMARIQASAKDASPAGDLSLIFNFMKMLDPGSVVRESEFNNAATAAPLLQRYGLEKYSRLWKGEKLTTDQRADFVKRARNIFSEIREQKNEIDGLYRGRAKRYGIPDSDILSPNLSTGEQQQDGMVRIQASDGSFHRIPQDKLAAAQQRDPGAKVVN
jgi:hypothetical protein